TTASCSFIDGSQGESCRTIKQTQGTALGNQEVSAGYCKVCISAVNAFPGRNTGSWVTARKCVYAKTNCCRAGTARQTVGVRGAGILNLRPMDTQDIGLANILQLGAA